MQWRHAILDQLSSHWARKTATLEQAHEQHTPSNAPEHKSTTETKRPPGTLLKVQSPEP